MKTTTQRHCCALKKTDAGTGDYRLPLAYLTKEFGIEKEAALNQVAVANSEYGINAFHFDQQRRNFYLLLGCTASPAERIAHTLRQFVTTGIETIFATEKRPDKRDCFSSHLASCLLENNSLIDQVYLRLIVSGVLSEWEHSEYLKSLVEQVEQKKFLIDRFFNGRNVRFTYDQRSVSAPEIGLTGTTSKTFIYDLAIDRALEQRGPGGEQMYIACMRLVDLLAMFHDMGNRFFAKNIRYGLGDTKYVNKSIAKAFRKIILEKSESPDVFAFNHNGVTIAAQEVRCSGHACRVVSPSLLNGAQTVTTFKSFCEKNNLTSRHPAYECHQERLESIRVLCKFITAATPAFITAVTVNNNRQNPVAPWDLHANDEIQLLLQDKFRSELGIYYERQKNATADIGEGIENSITERKKIKLLRLAQTFLASDGELELFGAVRDVFEDDELYENVFCSSRLKQDSRRIILCYKIQFRLVKILKTFITPAPLKYWYLKKARNLVWSLLCQAVLNDERLVKLCENFGTDMTITAEFTNYLLDNISRRCRPLITALEERNREKIEAGELDFLNKKNAFSFCMSDAAEKWKWKAKGLK